MATTRKLCRLAKDSERSDVYKKALSPDFKPKHAYEIVNKAYALLERNKEEDQIEIHSLFIEAWQVLKVEDEYRGKEDVLESIEMGFYNPKPYAFIPSKY
jgi:hypothetical protein